MGGWASLSLSEVMDLYQRTMFLTDAACATAGGMSLKRWHEIKYEGHRPQAGEYAQISTGLCISTFTAAALSKLPLGEWRAY